MKLQMLNHVRKMRREPVWSFIIGDLNMNMLCHHDRQAVNDVLDVYNIKNIIISRTCFKSRDNPSLLDVILTTSNTSKMIADVLNVNTGI